MRLRRYEISAGIRDRLIAAAVDCAEAAARIAREDGDAERAREFADTASTLLNMGECHVKPVEVDVEAEVQS